MYNKFRPQSKPCLYNFFLPLGIGNPINNNLKRLKENTPKKTREKHPNNNQKYQGKASQKRQKKIASISNDQKKTREKRFNK